METGSAGAYGKRNQTVECGIKEIFETKISSKLDKLFLTMSKTIASTSKIVATVLKCTRITCDGVKYLKVKASKMGQ